MMNKSNTVELIRKGVRALHDGGITVAAGIINGLRHDDADWRFFSGDSLLWELGLRPIVWLYERYANMRYGTEGRYKLQMKHYLDLNDFGIEAPGIERPATYHPVFGDASDPYGESREQLLARKLEFAPPAPALLQEPSTDPV